MEEVQYERVPEEPQIVKLMSVNAFKTQAKAAGLGFYDRKKIAGQLRLALNAETLSTRVTHLVALRNTLQNEFAAHAGVNDLLADCEGVLAVIFNLRDGQNLQDHIDHRERRLCFKPSFVSDAPAKAPCRQLLDDLVAWRQIQDKERAHRKLNQIAEGSCRSFNQVWGKTALDKTTKHYSGKMLRKSKIPYERRLFLWLSVGINLNHLLIKGTTRIIDSSKQESDYIKRPLVFSDKELEQYRVLAHQGILVQLTLQGRGDNASLVVRPFSTLGMSSHLHQKDDAMLVVTPDGDLFAGSSVAEDVIHPSFARGKENFYAGRIHVNALGVLRFLDNYSGHYLSSERNYFLIAQHFYDIGIIGRHNSDMIGLLTAVYHLPQGEQFISYCKKLKLPEQLLWETNRLLFQKSKTLSHKSATEQRAALVEIVEKARSTAGWKSTWEEKGADGKDLSFNPNYTYERVRDRLCSSPVNTTLFVDVKTHQQRKTEVPAPQDPDSGVYNDHDISNEDLENCRAELKALRAKIIQKCRLAEMNSDIAFCQAKPNNNELRPNTIYLYPMVNDATQCRVLIQGFTDFVLDYNTINNRPTVVRLANALKNHHAIDELDGVDLANIREAAVALKDYETYLIFTPEQLLNLYKIGVNPATVIESNVSTNVFIAFLDEQSRFLEVETNNHPHLQAENLFYGKMCLWRTNKGRPGNPVFNPNPERYQATVPFQETQAIKENAYF